MDTVYIVVPNIQHTRYARVALEAGRNVILKTLAPTAADAEGAGSAGPAQKVFCLKP